MERREWCYKKNVVYYDAPIDIIADYPIRSVDECVAICREREKCGAASFINTKCALYEYPGHDMDYQADTVSVSLTCLGTK